MVHVQQKPSDHSLSGHKNRYVRGSRTALCAGVSGLEASLSSQSSFWTSSDRSDALRPLTVGNTGPLAPQQFCHHQDKTRPCRTVLAEVSSHPQPTPRRLQAVILVQQEFQQVARGSDLPGRPDFSLSHQPIFFAVWLRAADSVPA
ncbi:hypothetical protein WJX74_006816 [Apatococcus lobatus]|uniref:Uncharacterized protein n=1 Tax=Apatococcus lobatus TaxID=904363 RepID=A0AAW1RDI3_9CHLO